MSVLGNKKICDLRGCSERYEVCRDNKEDDADYWEVKAPDDLAFGSRYCSVNCAKTALMRAERERGGDDDE